MKKDKKRPGGPNKIAHSLVSESLGESLPSPTQISMLMAELGRRGGKKGGKRRLVTMTPKQRQEIARKAAQARWKDNK
jgi:hypothetical protein